MVARMAQFFTACNPLSEWYGCEAPECSDGLRVHHTMASVHPKNASLFSPLQDMADRLWFSRYLLAHCGIDTNRGRYVACHVPAGERRHLARLQASSNHVHE